MVLGWEGQSQHMCQVVVGEGGMEHTWASTERCCQRADSRVTWLLSFLVLPVSCYYGVRLRRIMDG